MKTFKTKDLSFLLAVAPLMGAHASDTSEEDTARAFGLSLLEYRQQVSQYTGMASAHESTIAEREEDELARAMSASTFVTSSVAVSPGFVPSNAVADPLLGVDLEAQKRLEQEAEEAWILKQIAQAEAQEEQAILLQKQALLQGHAHYRATVPMPQDVQERVTNLRVLEETKAFLEAELLTVEQNERAVLIQTLEETNRKIARIHFSSRTVAADLTQNVEEDPHHIARVGGLNSFLGEGSGS
jgi:hypothetical protein